MLPLNSPRWLDLEAAGGSPLLVLRLIQSLATNPTPEDWAEVWEQVSHQWSGYTVAFAAVPHLVRLAIEEGLATDPGFLLGLGRTLDSVARLGPPPADLKDDFEAAVREAAPFAERAARTPGHSAEDYVSILHAAAALAGRRGLGTELLFSLNAGGPELHCPRCGGYLKGEFEEGGLTFQSVDSRMRPLSAKARVCPRPNGSLSQGMWTSDEYDCLEALCKAAGQDQVLHKIRLLYGLLKCPLCGAEMTVMPELRRNQD
jgi:hypothetical protein